MPKANPQKQHHRAGDRVNGNAIKLVFLTKERDKFHCVVYITVKFQEDQELFTQNTFLLSKTQETAQQFLTAERKKAAFRDTVYPVLKV